MKRFQSMLRAAGLFLALALVSSAQADSVAGNPLLDLFRGGGSTEPLPAEQAFPFSAVRTGPTELVARWNTREGYYLYRDKIRFELAGTEASIAAVQVPEGTTQVDQYFGEQQVHFEPLDTIIQLDRAPTTDFTLIAHFQGCSNAGLCYPPMKAEHTFTASSAATSTGAPAAPDLPANQGLMLAGLLSGGSLPLILGGYFLAGLLLAFTACLYPMIPILSGLIAGDRAPRTGGRAFMLSLVYVEATAITYALAGVLAGLSGQAIQADLQTPWVLGSFAALLVLLALAMFGLYDLQIPARLQTKLDALARRQKGGSYIGVGIMGVLSALIVGACSAPALVAALAFISGTGNAWLGGLALFVLANGMGLPLLLIGTAAGKWLPRSGAWMTTVKRIFGLGLLAAAIWILERILPGAVSLALWGALLIGCGVLLGGLTHPLANADRGERARKLGALLVMMWGALIIVGAATGSRSFWKPLEGLERQASDSQQSELKFQHIKSVDDLGQALQEARRDDRPVMLDVYADWCVYCVQLEERTFTDPEVRQLLSRALLLKADVTAMDKTDKALLSHLSVFLPPTVLFYGQDGTERKDFRVLGFMPPASFIPHARLALFREHPETNLQNKPL